VPCCLATAGGTNQLTKVSFNLPSRRRRQGKWGINRSRRHIVTHACFKKTEVCVRLVIKSLDAQPHLPTTSCRTGPYNAECLSLSYMRRVVEGSDHHYHILCLVLPTLDGLGGPMCWHRWASYLVLLLTAWYFMHQLKSDATTQLSRKTWSRYELRYRVVVTDKNPLTHDARLEGPLHINGVAFDFLPFHCNCQSDHEAGRRIWASTLSALASQWYLTSRIFSKGSEEAKANWWGVRTDTM